MIPKEIGNLTDKAMKGDLKEMAGAALSKAKEGGMMPKGLTNVVETATNAIQQSGGARKESGLSTEATVMGATVIALIAGGAIKMAVDSLVGN